MGGGESREGKGGTHQMKQEGGRQKEMGQRWGQSKSESSEVERRGGEGAAAQKDGR